MRELSVIVGLVFIAIGVYSYFAANVPVFLYGFIIFGVALIANGLRAQPVKHPPYRPSPPRQDHPTPEKTPERIPTTVEPVGNPCPSCGRILEKNWTACPYCKHQVVPYCPSCHKPVQEQWKVCPYCRHPLHKFCPSCNAQIQNDWLVCPSCQTTLKESCPGCGKPIEPSWTGCPYCKTTFT